jgi:hypothetical protein
MHNPGNSPKPALGFLTVVGDAEHGLFGGYLVLNPSGRPLEFHCTAPVRPNRAQEILYGPTLQPYLFGEQIGRTLLERSKIEPLAVCTDREPALAVREFVQVPVALVLPPEEGSEPHDIGPDTAPLARPGEKLWRIDPAHGSAGLVAFRLGPNRLAVPETAAEDRRAVLERLAGLAEGVDLAEPFGRIREAIEEARRGG